MLQRSFVSTTRRLLSSSSIPIYNPEFEFQTEFYTETETGIHSSFSSQTPKPTPPPLTPCPLADTLAHLLISHHNPFHPSESPLQLTGVGFSNELLTQTLLRLRNYSKPAFSLFIWARDHIRRIENGHVSADAYDLIIDSLGRARQFDAVWRVLIEMGQDGVGPTNKTFAVVIRRHVAAGFTREAIRAFDDMEAFIGREPDKEEFCMLLDTLCKYKFPKIAMELFNKRKYKYEPDEKMYTVLIYGWCRTSQLDRATKLLDEMIDRGIEPNIVTYNTLLNGICRHVSLHPETRFDRTIKSAEELLMEMRRRGIQPDVTSYSIVLHVYSRAHKPELTLCKFRAMKEQGISPSIATYTSVVKCLTSCGRLEDAYELLDEMSNNGIQPAPATYNCFFKEYFGRKDVNTALNLYQKMKGTGSFDIHTYHILLRMFIKLERFGPVQEIWKDMCEAGIGPDLDSYTLLVHGLCEKRKWRQACHMFMEMIEKGFLPQKVTFETLYRGLIQADMLQTWRRLKKRVDEEALKFGVEFDKYYLKPYKR
ncbi:hypothetical protein LUZ63_016954 [Rhynchospora breviuscula]|uniref:Pentatricopeptide repeat-containing protein n=1 Tax=Rhynchospora breviuscula TaxID=2022672 RepID=A0A9Q0C1J2_9POAL|nr:hypothetical protein LUZ63_016954 [Rhynchospora breviuscula]